MRVLDNWQVVKKTNLESVFFGNLHRDPRVEDGSYVSTSGVKNGRFKEGDVIETVNGSYVLGKFHNLKEGNK